MAQLSFCQNKGFCSYKVDLRVYPFSMENKENGDAKHAHV